MKVKISLNLAALLVIIIFSINAVANAEEGGTNEAKLENATNSMPLRPCADYPNLQHAVIYNSGEDLGIAGYTNKPSPQGKMLTCLSSIGEATTLVDVDQNFRETVISRIQAVLGNLAAMIEDNKKIGEKHIGIVDKIGFR